jgi:hypothetical protein
MDKEIKGSEIFNNAISPIYLEIYNKSWDYVRRNGRTYLTVKELRKIIIETRINGSFLETVKKGLREIGFTPLHIQIISDNLSWKLRYNINDAKAITRKLIQMNWLESGHGGKLYLRKGDA